MNEDEEKQSEQGTEPIAEPETEKEADVTTEPETEPAKETEPETETAPKAPETKAESAAKPEAKKKSSVILIVVLVAICAIFAAVIGVKTFKNDKGETTETTAAEATEEPAEAAEETTDAAAADTTETATTGINLETLYAAYDPKDVVMKVNGHDATWDVYYYFLQYYISYYDSMLSYYGYTWDDDLDGQGTTGFELVKQIVEQNVVMMYGMEDFAASNNVELTSAIDDQVNAKIAEDTVSCCGEGAAEEDFVNYLADNYMSLDVYKMIVRMSYVYDACQESMYGEGSENLSDAAVLAWMNEQGYMCATHILLMNTDSDGADLDEAAMAERKEQAESFVEELQSIKDPQERLIRFNALKEEFDEDTGKEYYPDGYTFLPGEMVTEFEDAVNALDDYEVSGVVESDYGYHVIMRLPLDPDAALESDGTTVRSSYADEAFTSAFDSYFSEDCSWSDADGFTLNLEDYYERA